MNTKELFARNGIHIPSILLPNTHINLKKWAVIACDQYTQDRNYWDSIAKKIENSPSTFHLILPEVYLEDKDRQRRLDSIRHKMHEYKTNKTLFQKPTQGFIYTERKTNYGRTRKGLVLAVDLEQYDWKPDSQSLIRATEETIIDRIPPRMEIRKNAPLELPHIMLLCNDPQQILIESIGEKIRQTNPLYTTALMKNSGFITGWALDTETQLNEIAKALDRLAQQETNSDSSCFLFAVGDGNHSLATAKAVWDEYKTKHKHNPNIFMHPARYALVELVNIYDSGLTFEPIHRVLFGSSIKELGSWLVSELGGTITKINSREKLIQSVNQIEHTVYGFVSLEGLYSLKVPDSNLAVSKLQPALDKFLQNHTQTSIDYIHGNNEVFRLGAQDKTLSIMLPPINKDNFFKTIKKSGSLPRKSFSMGEASEKRFYLESRALFD